MSIHLIILIINFFLSFLFPIHNSIGWVQQLVVIECYKRKSIVRIDGVDISVISKADLLINKKASGRYRELGVQIAL